MEEEIKRGSRGPAPNWNLGRTRSIRVPIVLADKLLRIARQLDRGEAVDTSVKLTESEAQELGESCAS